MKDTKRSVWLVMLPACLFLAHCTKEGDDPEISRLHQSIESLERQIATTEEALKSAPSENAGSLQNDKELAKSRLERLKERLKAKGGGSSSASGGGGGH